MTPSEGQVPAVSLPCPARAARQDSSSDGTGYCGTCTGHLADEAACIRSLMPQVLLLSIPGHSIVTHLFVSSVATLHLLGSLWDLSSPAPALSVCTGGSYCESSVHIYRDFPGPNHVFHRLHFLYFNKNGNGNAHLAA